MLEKLGIKESKVPELSYVLYKQYETTMAGLRAICCKFDYDDFHAFVHGRLPYDILKPDHVLSHLFLCLPIYKVVALMETIPESLHQIVPINDQTTIIENNVVTFHEQKLDAHHRNKSAHVSSRICQVLFRTLAALCFIGSTCIMLFFTEQTTFLGFTASYNLSPSFKFFVYGTGIVGMYSILSISFVLCCSTSKFRHIVDMLMMALGMAACSAAANVGYIAKFGNNKIGWDKVCDYGETFCNHSFVALLLSFAGFLFLFLVCLFFFLICFLFGFL